MAAMDGKNSIALDEITMIDRVSKKFAPLQDLHPARLANILCLAFMSWYGGPILLLHEQGNNTYLWGWSKTLDLTEEREVEELRGQGVVQVSTSPGGSVYILVEDGTLYSAGDASHGQLGRPHTRVPPIRFGAVSIKQAVRLVAAGEEHVLVMTSEQVFAFGSNRYGQLGVPGCCDSSQEPRSIYAGTGPAAPQHVACGWNHSVILTAGGQVLTCGAGGYTGQGHKQNIPELSEVPGLRDQRVQQVGSTWSCTYALTDGVIYGWGVNFDGRLGVGCKKGNYYILVPTVVDCGGSHIITVRCAGHLVIAVTDTGDCLFWGRDRDDVVIMSPQRITGHPLPRDVFGRGHESGGLVFLDTKDNHQRDVSDTRVTADTRLHAEEAQIAELKRSVEESIDRENAAMDERVSAENMLQKSKAKIVELMYSMEESSKREKAAMDATVSAENMLQKSKAKIVELMHSMEGSSKREKAAMDANVSAKNMLQKSKAKIVELMHSMEENSKRQKAEMDARVSAENMLQQSKVKIAELMHSMEESSNREKAEMDARVSAENMLQQSKAKIAELMHSLGECFKREKAVLEAFGQADHDRPPHADRIHELQHKIMELETAQHASAEKDFHGENAASEALGQDDRIDELEMAQHAHAERDVHRENAHKQCTHADARIAELEKEIRELRLEKREQLLDTRSTTVDYREIRMEYNSHLETFGTNPMRGVGDIKRK